MGNDSTVSLLPRAAWQKRQVLYIGGSGSWRAVAVVPVFVVPGERERRRSPPAAARSAGSAFGGCAASAGNGLAGFLPAEAANAAEGVPCTMQSVSRGGK